jgi:integrase
LLYSVAVKEDSISSPAHEIQNLSNKLFPINAPIEATEISDVTLIQTEDKNKPTTNESIVIKSNSGYKLDTELRNDIMCQLKNIVGFNINELHQLKWCDIITNEGSGQVVVFGKVIPSSILQKMELIKYTSDLNNPVFSSNKGSKLSIDSIRKIIREVTKKTENINNVNDQLLEHIPSKQLELNLFKL